MAMATVETDYEARSYQADGLDSVEKIYNGGTQRQLFVASMGLGKTVTFAFLPHWFPDLVDERMLVLAHRDELVFQAAETLRAVNPNLSVGVEKAEYRASRTADIVVASVQTLGRQGSSRIKKFAGQFGLIVVDEAHRCKPGGTYDRVLSYFGVGSEQAKEEDAFEIGAAHTRNGKKRLLTGYTATPQRNDGIGLEHFFDEIAANFDIRWAIDNGWLVDFTSDSVTTNTDISNVSKSGGDYNSGELEKAINRHDRNDLIVSGYQNHARGRKAIAYCAGVDHAYDLAAAFRGAGIEARAADAETDRAERRRLVKNFKDPDGDVQILCNVGLWTEGANFPRMQTIIMARPTKSKTLFTQIIGRVLRTWPTLDLGSIGTKEGRIQAIQQSPKPLAQVLEFTDNTKTHGPPLSVASLFGLQEDFDLEGQPVFQTLDEVEKKERENPGKSLREATSMDEIETLVESVNVWDLCDPSAAPAEDSAYQWFEISEGRYQLEVPAGARREDAPGGDVDTDWEQRNFYVQLEKNELGKYQVSLHWPEGYAKGGVYQPERSVDGSTSRPSLGEAMQDVDAWVDSKYSDVASLAEREPSWGKAPASRGQVNYLDRLGVPLSRNKKGDVIDLHSGDVLTKGKASALISAKKQMN